jgi:membrane-bound ClpP family serine protease
MRQPPTVASATLCCLTCLAPAALADGARPAGLVVPVHAERMMDLAERLPRLLDRPPRHANGDGFRLVLDFNPEGRPSASGNFGAARELVRSIRSAQKGRVLTVAFVHGEVARHSVLPVLACDEIVLGDAARLGPVLAAGAALDADERLAYEQAAGRRPLPLKAPLTAEQAAAVARRRVGSLDELLDAYSLDRSALLRVPARPVVALLTLTGGIDGTLKERLERHVRDARGRRADLNVLILRLECGGGDSGKAEEIARWLLTLDEGVETIAYVTPQARDTASLIAFACDRIVMAPSARLGGWESYVRSHPQREAAIRDALGEIAAAKGHPTAVARALVEHDQTLVKSAAGDYLTLDAPTAKRLGVAEVSDGLGPIYEKLDVNESDVLVLKHDFLDAVGELLRNDWARMLLVLVGIACLVLELKLPGTTLPAVIAAFCFVLFFWSHAQLNQPLAVLAGLLFLLGLGLLAAEVFLVPGTACCAVAGAVLTLGSLGLAAYGHWPHGGGEWAAFGRAVSPLGLAVLGAVGLAFLVARYLPRIPLANRLMLDPHAAEGGEDGPPPAEGPERPETAELLGAIGVAATPLRPAGKSQFGDDFVDVVAEGGYVAPGTRVQVVEIEGNRVVVKEV